MTGRRGNADVAGDDPVRLAEEQAALRRVAALVARRASSADTLAAVAREVAGVMHVPLALVSRYDADGTAITIIAAWSDQPHPFQPETRWSLDGPSVCARVLHTRRPARIESYVDLDGAVAAAVRASGIETAAAAPIIVEGQVWGVIAVSSQDATLPDHVEDRLGEFTALLATAIASGQAREELSWIVEEQAALRRVATLVAEGAPPAAVFEALIAEVGQLVPTDAAALTRYEPDGTVTMIGQWSRTGGSVGGGEHHALGNGTLARLVYDTRKPGRIDSYADASGSLAGVVRAFGWRSSVGAPIVVEGRLWGVVGVASTTDRALPLDLEPRLVEFSELLAAAIANTQAREELTRLADEQAALRRVATLVARGVPPVEVFEAVTEEVGRLIDADASALSRYEPDGTYTVVSAWRETGAALPAGRRYPLDTGTAAWKVFDTRRAARVDTYAGLAGPGAAAARELGHESSVAAPVIVEGRLWGMAIVLSRGPDPLPPDTERRVSEFTELVATAVANAESRAELDASRARIVATADATRRRIERDLHDGAQQQLVSLALELRAAQARTPPELR
ncbi:MAG TPA: GAF domain-containing protein, partial [Gaiellaceae bacterium]|nr:GAF domain-containing protein [Gaiellaceae bacterium]